MVPEAVRRVGGERDDGVVAGLGLVHSAEEWVLQVLEERDVIPGNRMRERRSSNQHHDHFSGGNQLMFTVQFGFGSKRPLHRFGLVFEICSLVR